MGIPSKRIRALFGLAGLLGLSHCATTQETFQDCRKAAISFCEKTVGAKDARAPAFQQCLETQVAACGPP